MPNGTRERALLYRATDGVGLGHILVSLSYYAGFARRTGRRFYATVKNTSMAADDGSDIDPIFTDMLDYTGGDYADAKLAYSAFSERVERVVWNGEHAVLVGRTGNEQRLKPEFPELFDSPIPFLDRTEFWGRIHRNDPFEEDVIIIDNINPIEGKPGQEVLLDGVGPFAPFSDGIKSSINGNSKFSRYIALHIRHGNGEHLDGRPNGGAAKFDSMLGNMATVAGSLRLEMDIEHVLVLGDNSEAVDKLCKLTDGYAPAKENLANIPFQAHLKSAPSERYHKLEEIYRDFCVLANAEVICGGASLFVLGAYLWSKNRRLIWASP